MVSEFEFIDNIKSKYGLSAIGDDCAVIPKDSLSDTLITVDMLIEDIDFRLAWSTPEQIGYKALAVSLSDIAAMGGDPKWAMVSIGVPDKLWKDEFLDGFYKGWHRLAKVFQVELLGGDISKSPDPLVIDSIAGGEVPKGKAILRSGAKPGDSVYISGPLGAAAGGLKILSSGGNTPTGLIKKQLEPTPSVSLGKYLQKHDLATAAIDVSDGLSSDLGHLCRSSGVGARIDADLVPVEPLLADVFTRDECLDLALNGGEDLRLLFTMAEGSAVVGTARIGVITDEAGRIELVQGGKASTLEPKGFTHF